MKIIDCFMFYNEFVILDIRFRELYDIVDKFIVIESKETFSGIPKTLQLSECLKERYPQYYDKVEIIVPENKHFENPWHREYYQGNHICKEKLSHLNLDDDDLILISDADEIPRRRNVLEMRENGYNKEGGFLHQRFYYYKLNIQLYSQMRTTSFISYGNLTNRFNIRDCGYDGKSVIDDAGWHFSYLNTPKKIKEKIEAFSHQEFNHEHYTNEQKIEERIKGLKDLYDREGEHMRVVPIDDSFPEYVKENVIKLKEWISFDR